MIVARKVQRVMAGCLIASAMALTISGQAVTAPNIRPSSPSMEPDIVQNAAVIKTKAAADQLLNQGAVRGIDVSKYQGNIDWAQVATSNVQFAFIRASYGMTEDPYFVTNAQQAHKNGIAVGAYHYSTFQNRSDMQAQAKHFLSLLKKVDITYPVVLDLESPLQTSIPASTLTSLATEFMDILRAEGYSVMLYSYNNFIRDHLNVGQLAGYDLWIANYLERPTVTEHQIWQHTASGSVSGIRGTVDINIAYTGMASGAHKTQINKTQSVLIRETINQRYGADLPLDELDMQMVNHTIATSLQQELAKQWKEDLHTTGTMGTEELDMLSSVNWNSNTHGNITYLLQAKLFYEGYYTGGMTAYFDQDTVEAVAAFQRAKGIQVTSVFDYNTLKKLFA